MGASRTIAPSQRRLSRPAPAYRVERAGLGRGAGFDMRRADVRDRVDGSMAGEYGIPHKDFRKAAMKVNSRCSPPSVLP